MFLKVLLQQGRKGGGRLNKAGDASAKLSLQKTRFLRYAKERNRSSHFDEVCDCSKQAFPKLRVIWTSLSILWKQVMSLSHLLHPSITCKTPDPWLVTYRLQKEMIWFWGKVYYIDFVSWSSIRPLKTRATSTVTMQKKKPMAANYNLCAIQYQAFWI